MLRKLVEQTGKTETANLTEIARKSYETKNSDDIDEEIQAANLAEIMRAISQHDVAMTIEELDELRLAENKEKEAENGTGEKDEDVEDAAENISKEESDRKDQVRGIEKKDEELNLEEVRELDDGLKAVDGTTGETPVGDVDDEEDSQEKSKLLADVGKKADDLDVLVGKVDENDEADETENLLSKDEHQK